MAGFDITLEQQRRRMVTLLTELTIREGMRPSILESVKLGRADRDCARLPVMHEPSIYIVASGRKRGFVGDRCIIYDRNNYLVLSVPLPFECETEVDEGEPMLGMSVRLEMSLISELAIKMDITRWD